MKQRKIFKHETGKIGQQTDTKEPTGEKSLSKILNTTEVEEFAYQVKAKLQSGQVLNEPRNVKCTGAHKAGNNTKRPKKVKVPLIDSQNRCAQQTCKTAKNERNGRSNI